MTTRNCRRRRLPNKLNEEEADKTTSAFQPLPRCRVPRRAAADQRQALRADRTGRRARLVCLDPKNLVVGSGPAREEPTLVWSQKLGRPNSTLPQDSIRRYQGATLAASEGIIVCPTNSGAIVAVDIMSRSLLWAHAYRDDRPERAAAQLGFDPNTGQPIMPEQLPRRTAGAPAGRSSPTAASS